VPIVTTHGVPAWLTVNVLPPIEMVPERPALPGFAATLNVVLPEPLPDMPPVMLIQLLLLVAVQSHPEPAVTAIVPPSADELTD
jgi:hypothetical protein